MINSVILVGRITRDPEIRYTNTGIASLNFTVAVDRGMRDNNGERQADFINCVAWRNNAEFLSKYVKKGYMISVEGRIQTRNYQSNTTNQTVYVTEVVCESVSNLQPRDNTQSQPYQQNQTFNNGQNNYNNNNFANNNNQSQRNSFNNQQSPSAFSITDVAEDDLPF